MSEVAVPGRTAHEGKPASHDTSVPSPPHPPEGAGTLGRYQCGVKEIRRQAELAVGHPPPPTGHEPLGRTVSADIAITAFEPDMHALAGNGSMTHAM